MFECTVCRKIFNSKSNLKLHTKSHAIRKKYSCDHCQKQVSGSDNLVKHIRIHTGELPFSCDICYKKFSQKVNMLTHRRTHTGEKPYRCDLCDASFSHSGSLKHHKKIHSGQTEVFDENNCKTRNTCQICGEVFNHVAPYLKHKMKHVNKGTKILSKKNSNLMRTKESKDNSMLENKPKGKRNDKKRGKHIRYKSSNKEFITSNFICNICDISFKVSEEYVKHSMNHVKRKVDVKLKKLRSKLVKLFALKQDCSSIPAENDINDASAIVKENEIDANEVDLKNLPSNCMKDEVEEKFGESNSNDEIKSEIECSNDDVIKLTQFEVIFDDKKYYNGHLGDNFGEASIDELLDGDDGDFIHEKSTTAHQDVLEDIFDDYTNLNNIEVTNDIPNKVDTIINDQKPSLMTNEKSKPKKVKRFKEVFITNVKKEEKCGDDQITSNVITGIYIYLDCLQSYCSCLLC